MWSKFLEINYFQSVYYPIRCPGVLTHNIPKELCSPIRKGFIESKGMVFVTATASKNGSETKSWRLDELYN